MDETRQAHGLLHEDAPAAAHRPAAAADRAVNRIAQAPVAQHGIQGGVVDRTADMARTDDRLRLTQARTTLDMLDDEKVDRTGIRPRNHAWR